MASPPPPCSAAALHHLGCASSDCRASLQEKSGLALAPAAVYASLYGSDSWRGAVDANSGWRRFGVPFANSGWLRSALAGQGLVPGAPSVWPANITFEQILDEAAGSPLSRAGGSGFAVNCGAGDGKRLDIYHKPIDPVYPLLERGFGALAIEADRRYDGGGGGGGGGTTDGASVAPMPYASGNLLKAMSEVNQSGRVRVAWAPIIPGTVGELLRAHGTPPDLDALSLDLDGAELPVLSAILAAGYAPKALALNFNPDVPPPLQTSFTRVVGATGGSSSNASRRQHRLLGAAVASGLTSASADACYALLSPRCV